MLSADKQLMSYEVEKDRGFYDWAGKVPWIHLPGTMEMRPVPPFHGALCRFGVRLRKRPKQTVSVYLDTQDTLGAVGQPYWEMYPNYRGDAERFLLGEEQKLEKAIIKSLYSTQHRGGIKKRES